MAYLACPRCDWRPDSESRWVCNCGHAWNTFDTHGICPSCGQIWAETCCLSCASWSDHEDWYHTEEDLTVEAYLADPRLASQLPQFQFRPPWTPPEDEQATSHGVPFSREADFLKAINELQDLVERMERFSEEEANTPDLLLEEKIRALRRETSAGLDEQDLTDLALLRAGSNRTGPTDGHITLIVPIGAVPQAATLATAEALKATFIHEVALGETMSLPRDVYREDRYQYRAVGLLKTLNTRVSRDIFRVIGLIDADIYLPGTNFVFGTQLAGSRGIVVGLGRLRQSAIGENEVKITATLRRRVAATVISQVSASLGLGPCLNDGCARAPSNSLADTDRKTDRLCPACAARIATWLKPSYKTK